MRDLKEIEELLNAKIPREVVSRRDGGGGKKLDYLEGYYVIDRLNKIFGPLGWTKEITDVRQVVNTTHKGDFPAYLVKVKLQVFHNEGGWVTKEGYGYGSDKSSQNAHELAIKEAVTDALKVAAKDLGMSMGLALYDKTQEFVDDGEETEAPAAAKPPVSEAKPASQSAPKTHADVLKLISATASAVVASKRASKDDVVKMVTAYGVKDKSELNHEQALKLLKQLEEKLK